MGSKPDKCKTWKSSCHGIEHIHPAPTGSKTGKNPSQLNLFGEFQNQGPHFFRIAARWHSRIVNPPGRFFQIALWRTEAVKTLIPYEWGWVFNSHLKKLHDNGCKTPSPLKRKEIRNENLYPKKCIPHKKMANTWQTIFQVNLLWAFLLENLVSSHGSQEKGGKFTWNHHVIHLVDLWYLLLPKNPTKPDSQTPTL